MNDKKCAASDRVCRWEDIDFRKAEACVIKLQRRISKAWANDEFDKAEFLQHRMIHSFYAKALSVRTVTTSKGKVTPGVDGIIGKDMTPEEKWELLMFLQRRGYSSKPLRRIEVSKPNGKMRPLSIPTVRDRAMQTLYKLALEPIAEVVGDPHSYGFRTGRSTRQAMMQCIEILSAPEQPEWILECDIQSCFDNINHEWIMKRIPMDKKILFKFLKCGFVQDDLLYPTNAGIPQGSCISPTICNMVLDGLEIMLAKEFCNSVQFVRYADDFVIIGSNPDLLKSRVLTAVETFMAERGLHLSSEKTVVTHIDCGFDFLGWNVKRTGSKLLLTPSQKNLLAFTDKVFRLVECNRGSSTDWLCDILKPVISGWICYHKDIVMPYVLYDVEFDIVNCLWQITRNSKLVSFVGNLFRTV